MKIPYLSNGPQPTLLNAVANMISVRSENRFDRWWCTALVELTGVEVLLSVRFSPDIDSYSTRRIVPHTFEININ